MGAPKKSKKSNESINARLALVMKSGRELVFGIVDYHQRRTTIHKTLIFYQLMMVLNLLYLDYFLAF